MREQRADEQKKSDVYNYDMNLTRWSKIFQIDTFAWVLP
jgi:hypothetical protein